MVKKSAWEKAFTVVDASLTAEIRRLTKGAPLPGLISSPKDLKASVKRLPENLTVVQLHIDEKKQLWFLRLHCSHEPLDVFVANAGHMKDAEAKMDEALGVAVDFRCYNEVQLTSNVKKLSAGVGSLVANVEKGLTALATPLLLPLSGPFKDTEEKKKIIKVEDKLLKLGYNEPSAVTLARLLDSLTMTDWEAAAKVLLAKDCGHIVPCWEKLHKKLVDGRNRRLGKERFVVMVVPPKLSSFPWEEMPIWSRAACRAFVSRVPSVHFLFHLLEKNKCWKRGRVNNQYQLPAPVVMSKTFASLDPDDSLAYKERIFSLMNTHFYSVETRRPPNEEFRRMMSNLDMFFYLGHGNGGFGEIYESNAAIVMLGCSSVSLLPRKELVTPEEFHERSSLLSYLLAGCPAVVGCLWSVESDIEHLAIALVELFPKSPGETCLLGEALVKAKAACECPYFTGGAVVVYGLPVRFFAGSATAH